MNLDIYISQSIMKREESFRYSIYNGVYRHVTEFDITWDTMVTPTVNVMLEIERLTDNYLETKLQ